MNESPLIVGQSRVELLSPAQNLKSVKAVVNLADSVYFGVETLNMRMHSENISIDDLANFCTFCHESGLKCYLTTNVIIYENELEYLTTLLTQAKKGGIDAVIVHDMATLETARELGIPVHISTQASVSNSKAAQFYENLGVDRIILARECSLNQIQEIASKLAHTRIETFIHGAQCTSISGRCYFSATVHDNRDFSANRGKCLQPCRQSWRLIHENGTELDYSDGFFLNSKDLCMIEYIPQLIQAGIAAFKIEGRMRDPYYIQTVTQCYREAIDAYYSNTYTQEKVQAWMSRLKQVYHRGFSTGFYFHQPTPTDIASQTSGNQATTKKIQIGKVLAYYREVKAAKIELTYTPLRIGDEIIIEGTKLGTYLKQKITSMQLKRKAITETPTIPKEESLLITISIDDTVKKGDFVYIYRST